VKTTEETVDILWHLHRKLSTEAYWTK